MIDTMSMSASDRFPDAVFISDTLWPAAYMDDERPFQPSSSEQPIYDLDDMYPVDVI